MIYNHSQNPHQKAPAPNKNYHRMERKWFAIILLIIQIIVIICYGNFVMIDPEATEKHYQTRYPFYIDIIVMMVFGYGFALSMMKYHRWSSLSYTFMINPFVVQLYLLIQPFWHLVFTGKWENYTIYINIPQFILAQYCVTAMQVGYTAIVGRVGPLSLIIMTTIGIIGYCLNAQIVYVTMGTIDAGGSIGVHLFGACYGLGVSAVLSRIQRTDTDPSSTKLSQTMACLSTFFFWVFWPSINSGFFGRNPFQISLIVMNTIWALIGSTMTAYVISTTMKHKFHFEDILVATLAGGVGIGAPANIIINSGVSIFIGIIAGIISSVGYLVIGPRIDRHLGVEDKLGTNNLHGIPGILGGIVSALVLVGYSNDPLDQKYLQFLPFGQINSDRSLLDQAGIQIAETAISIGIGIVTGLIGGLIIKCFYSYRPQQFFQDYPHFELKWQQEEKQYINQSMEQMNVPKQNQ